MMKYSEVLEYLYSRLPMYQREGKSAFKKDLTNTLTLLDRLGNPHKKFKSIHIAGTNGKGTSAHAIAAIMQEAGYRVGLYTSPHLKAFTERIKLNGAEIEQQFVVDFVNGHQEIIDEILPSFFEVTVAMAFQYFAHVKAEIVIVETGLGGRLDSTNVINPEVSLITTIGLEHTDMLGDTLEKIAFEKAGIIKPKTPVVVGQIDEGALEVIQEIAIKNDARFIKSRKRLHDFDLKKVPPYTELNLPGILAVIDELKQNGWRISNSDVKMGVENYPRTTGLKGRFQILRKKPIIVADVSHNKDGILMLLEMIKAFEFERLHIIYGTVKDKPIEDILKVLPSDATFYFTESSVPRKLAVDDLIESAELVGLKGKSFSDVNGAKKAALLEAAADDLILITGSTFVVAELDDL